MENLTRLNYNLQTHTAAWLMHACTSCCSVRPCSNQCRSRELPICVSSQFAPAPCAPASRAPAPCAPVVRATQCLVLRHHTLPRAPLIENRLRLRNRLRVAVPAGKDGQRRVVGWARPVRAWEGGMGWCGGGGSGHGSSGACVWGSCEQCAGGVGLASLLI